jgi:AcrR family transcriptional regulator
MRNIILDAMGHLMERLGYGKTTIEDIAQEVGIGKGSIYLYFQSKGEIAVEWLERMFGELAEELKGISKQDIPPEERAELFLKRRVMFRYDKFINHSYSLEQMLASLKSEMISRKERCHAYESELLCEVLLEIGGDRANEAFPCAQAMVQATHSLLPYSHRVSDMEGRNETEKIVERMAQLMVGGYKSLYGSK